MPTKNSDPEIYLMFANLHITFAFNVSNSKVDNILKGSLDSIPSPLVKIQIMGRKVLIEVKGKTLLGKKTLLKTKSLLTTPNNILPLHPKQTFPPII